MTAPNDRLRALDQVKPADAWTDITARAEGPLDLPLAPAAAGSKLRRPALVAAAVLAVIGLGAGVVVLAGRPGDKSRPVGSDSGLDAPTAIWGRTWRLTEMKAAGQVVPVVPTLANRPAVLTMDGGGEFTLPGCERPGRAELHGSQLQVRAWPSGGDGGCGYAGQPSGPRWTACADEPATDHSNPCHVAGSEPAESTQPPGPPRCAPSPPGGAEPYCTPDGGSMTTPATSPQEDCAGPPAACNWGARGSQMAVLDVVLESSASVEVRGDSLVLGGGGYSASFVDARSFDEPSSVLGRRWAVRKTVEYQGGGPITETTPANGEPLVIDFGAADLVAYIGCGRELRASAKVEGDTVAVVWSSDPSPSGGSCGVLSFASAATVLESQPVIEVRDRSLILRSSTGSVEATLVDDSDGGTSRGGATEAFWGRRWTVVERFDVGGAALPLVDGFRGATPVLDSRDEGTISLTAGCYGTGANVTLADSRLTITEILPQAAVKLPCADDQLAQDEWFGALLAESPAVSVRGPRLTLTTASGKRVELLDIEGIDGDTATTFMPPGVAETTPPTDPGGPPSGPGTPPGPNTSSDPSGSTGSPVLPKTPSAPPSDRGTALASEQADGKFLGHHWVVERIDVDGGSDPGFGGAVVDASRAGQVTVSGCNGAGGAMRLDGDRLRADGEWNHTLMGCMSADGADQSMAQDEWFDSFLSAAPTVSVSGRTATLTTSDATVSLRLP